MPPELIQNCEELILTVFHNYLSCTTHDHLYRGNKTHSGLNFTPSFSNLKKIPIDYCMPFWQRKFLNKCALFRSYYSLCQLDNKHMSFKNIHFIYPPQFFLPPFLPLPIIYPRTHPSPTNPSEKQKSSITNISETSRNVCNF